MENLVAVVNSWFRLKDLGLARFLLENLSPETQEN